MLFGFKEARVQRQMPEVYCRSLSEGCDLSRLSSPLIVAVVSEFVHLVQVALPALHPPVKALAQGSMIPQL